MTYGEIQKEFITFTELSSNKIDDYRPCSEMYDVPFIENAIVVWLKNGSKIIYIHKNQKPPSMIITDRKVEIFVKFTGEWINVWFSQIKDGMLFRIYDGEERYADDKGNTVWIASGTPYLNAKGIWEVKTLY